MKEGVKPEEQEIYVTKKRRYLPHGTYCCKLEVLKNSLLIMGTYSEYLDSLIIMVWLSSR